MSTQIAIRLPDEMVGFLTAEQESDVARAAGLAYDLDIPLLTA